MTGKGTPRRRRPGGAKVVVLERWCEQRGIVHTQAQKLRVIARLIAELSHPAKRGTQVANVLPFRRGAGF